MQAAPCEAAVPRSKKQRTLHAIRAAAADEPPVINIRSAKAPPAVALPSQHAAIGWRIRVREQHDRRRMTDAVVRDYDPPTGAPLDERSLPVNLKPMLYCKCAPI